MRHCGEERNEKINYMKVERKAMWVENNCLKRQKYAASV